MIKSSLTCTHALMLTLTGLAACGDDGGSPAIDAAPPSIDAPLAAGTCASYCSTIATNCTGANAMYSSEATCLATCATWAPGLAADTAGNTRGCRVYHAGAPAAMTPTTHCRHAGPGGDGACGANCDGFCTLAMGACSAQQPPPYASLGACMTACANFPAAPPYEASQTGGDTFACRLYHATVASTTPMTHCAHVVPVSPTCR